MIVQGCRASLVLTLLMAALNAFGLAHIPWWWLLSPLWLALPAYLLAVVIIVVAAACATVRSRPPEF